MTAVQQEQSDQKRSQRPGASARKLIGGALATSAVLFAAVSPAFAGVGLSATVDPPNGVTVGQTNVPASVTVRNMSTGPQAAQGLTLEQITLVPSCGTRAIALLDCLAAAVDPGVLGLTTTVVGEFGTGCAGIPFTATLIDLLEGKYQLTPQTPVVLGPVGSQTSSCVVDFTVNVLKVPVLDANLLTPGLQTVQLAAARAVDADGNRAGSFGSSEVTIDPGAAAITLPATPAVATPAAPAAAAVTPATAAPAVVAAASSLAVPSPAAKTKAHRKTKSHAKRRHHHKRHAARHRAKPAKSHAHKARRAA